MWWIQWWNSWIASLANALLLLSWCAGEWKLSSYHPLENPDPGTSGLNGLRLDMGESLEVVETLGLVPF